MTEIEIKVIFLGETTVGKSSLILRYDKDDFKDYIPNTIGTAFITKFFDHKEDSMKMHIWDTCGQERFMAIANIFYRDADIILLTLDCDNKQSFYQAENYLNIIKSKIKNPVILLVINKIDLLEDFDENSENFQEIAKDCEFYEEIINFAKKNNFDTFWVSAKYDVGVKQLFEFIVNGIFDESLKIIDDKEFNKKDKKMLFSKSTKKNDKKKKCC